MEQAAQLIFPVLRKAELTHTGEALIKPIARKIAKEIKTQMSNHLKSYEQLLKDAFAGCEIKVKKEENDIREEGNRAYVVDFPIIVVSYKSFNYQIRITTAVCYLKSSTKNWTRVSIDEGIKLNDNSLPEVEATYNKIASICCKKNQEIFEGIVRRVLSDNPSSVGDFTVFTIGVSDPNLGKYLDLFDNLDLKLEKLFSTNKDAEKVIRDYYKKLFKKTIDINNSENNYWITSSANFINNEDLITESNILYNISKENKSIRAEGILFDESNDGSIARISSLKVARIYAPTL